MKDITLKLSRQEYLDLLKVLEIAHEVTANLDEGYKKYEMLHRRVDGLSKIALALGEDGGEDSVTERDGELSVSDDVSDYIEKLMDDYDEDIFWEELKHRLSERDFLESLAKTDKKKLKNIHEKIPELAKKFYEGYDDEFKKRGIERLRLG